MDDIHIFQVDYYDSFFKLVFDKVLMTRFLDLPILCLIIFFIFYYALTYKFRHSIIVTSIIFLLSCAFIYLSQSINMFLSMNWEDYGFSRNYFDANGDFILIFWIIPCSIPTFFIIFVLFIDLCKTIAVHHFFDKMIPEKPANEYIKQENYHSCTD